MFIKMVGKTFHCPLLNPWKTIFQLNRSYQFDKNVERYVQRSHTCGELRKSNSGQEVTLLGWLHNIRYGGKFIVIRDSYGITQVFINNKNLRKSLPSLESSIEIRGVVQNRPPGQENKEMPTGDIEIMANDLNTFNTSKDTPFQIMQHASVSEGVRLEYRYLDLRTSPMQRNLRLRSDILFKMREFLCRMNGFVDVETPTLFRRTPGGAREFVVPTRHEGLFYSLTQSPQQFKQLLMVGGVDRYMQIARCYRDETAKPDRQPEFTQLDLELSFVSRENIYSLIEDLLKHSWPDAQVDDQVPLMATPTPFTRMSWRQAMELYGTDKPDTRFDMTIRNLGEDFRGFVISKEYNFSADDLQALIDNVNCPKGFEAHILSNNLVKQPNIPQLHDPEDLARIRCNANMHDDDILLYSTGDWQHLLQFLGRCRLEAARIISSHSHDNDFYKDGLHFVWVEDFPLFIANDSGKLESAHHPFTAPVNEHLQQIYTHPEKVISQHFDLVCNGNEIAGGSIRVHDAELQKYILDNILGESSSDLSHIIKALSFGAPPHGGIAIGLDRFLALICKSPTIRDVIAFPKSSDSKDLMAGAPAPIDSEAVQYYHQTEARNEPHTRISKAT